MKSKLLIFLLSMISILNAQLSSLSGNAIPNLSTKKRIFSKKKQHYDKKSKQKKKYMKTFLAVGMVFTTLAIVLYKRVETNQKINKQESEEKESSDTSSDEKSSKEEGGSSISSNETPKEQVLLLTKADINDFYEQNKEYCDIDQLISTQKNWELDEERMKQWVQKMKGAWEDLPKQTKNKWISYWIRCWLPKNDDKKAYKAARKKIKQQNILHLFAEKYIEKLRENFVTWIDFKEQVEKVGKETVAKIKEKNYKDIFFLVPGSIEKSNTWMFFIFWKYIKDAIPESAKCHFVTPSDAANILEKGDAKIEDSLLLAFDDMSYSGSQMREYLSTLKAKGYPLYVIMPYITHRAKRQLTGLDPEYLRLSGSVYYDQDYVAGRKPHIWKKDQLEKDWFEKASIRFMPSTRVVQEILFELSFLGSKEYTTTPILLPFKVADHASILTAVIAYSIYPMGNDLSQEGVDQFQPVSFLKGHDYTPNQVKRINDSLFFKKDDDDSDDTDSSEKAASKEGKSEAGEKISFNLLIPLEMEDSLLPIQAVYKNREFTFKTQDREGSEKIIIFSNDPNKDNSWGSEGIFDILRDAKR